MKDDIRHSPLPRGPNGQFGFHLFQSHMVMRYSKNQKAAKEFLGWIHTPANYEKWFVSQKGYSTPPTAQWEKHKMWDEDPVMAPFKIAGRLGLSPGYAGPPSRKSAEVLTKYIITDMYAKGVQGMTPQEAVKWAAGEVSQIYSGS